MKYLLVLLMMGTAQAATLIVDSPSGEQKQIEVGRGGAYFDEARVVWDTRTNGPIPQGSPTVGGLYRCFDSLCEDATKRAAHDAALAARAQVAAEEAAVNADLVTRKAQVEAFLTEFDAAVADWPAADNAAVKAQVLRNARALRFLLKSKLRK